MKLANVVLKKCMRQNLLSKSRVMPNWSGGGKPIQMVKIVFVKIAFVKIVLEGLRFL